jgi:hypothetical protein
MGIRFLTMLNVPLSFSNTPSHCQPTSRPSPLLHRGKQCHLGRDLRRRIPPPALLCLPKSQCEGIWLAGGLPMLGGVRWARRARRSRKSSGLHYKKSRGLWRSIFRHGSSKFVIKWHLWWNLRTSCIERHGSLLVTSLNFHHRLAWSMTFSSRHRLV